MNRYLILICLCVLSLSGWSQDSDSSASGKRSSTEVRFGGPAYTVGLRGQFGFLIAHRPSMVHLINEHIVSFEAYVEKPSSGMKQWHHLYRQPTYGLAFFAGGTGSSRIIGQGYAVIHYVNLHFVKRDRFEWNLRLGTGLGWITKPFDPADNNKNNAVGSHLNGVMSLQNSVLFKGKKWDAGFGLSFTHFSNGAFKMPNLGINMPALFINANYKIGDHTQGLLRKKFTPIKPHIYLAAFFNSGLKEINPPGGKKYAVFGLHPYAMYQAGPKSGFAIGADVFYNSSYSTLYENQTGIRKKESQFIQAGLNFTYEISLDELKLVMQTGVYLNEPYSGNGNIYNRLVMRYHFKNNMLLSFGLKTHLAKADYIELGLGYRLKSKTIGKKDK